jgi:TatD DNase family protein
LPSLVDSHAHLDLLSEGAGQAVAEARDLGVAHIIAVGIDLPSSHLAAAAASDFPGVFAAVGIHPHDAGKVTSEALSELEALALKPRVIAIGETGLDYYRHRAPADAQRDAFLAHIRLARQLELPLIVHTRDAAADTLEILEREAPGLTVILHCFSLYGRVEECADRGYFMSIAGNVTFPKASELREAAQQIPAELLLTETDAPYLTPVPHRGKPNSPANVRFVTGELAALRGADPRELAKQILANFHTAFRLNAPA